MSDIFSSELSFLKCFFSKLCFSRCILFGIILFLQLPFRNQVLYFRICSFQLFVFQNCPCSGSPFLKLPFPSSYLLLFFSFALFQLFPFRRVCFQFSFPELSFFRLVLFNYLFCFCLVEILLGLCRRHVLKMVMEIRFGRAICMFSNI